MFFIIACLDKRIIIQPIPGISNSHTTVNYDVLLLANSMSAWTVSQQTLDQAQQTNQFQYPKQTLN